MFDTLFSRPYTVARHREGPWAEARERYLRLRADQGASRGTLQCLAHRLLLIAERIDLSSGARVTRQEVERAGERWVRYQRRRYRAKSTCNARERFVGVATRLGFDSSICWNSHLLFLPACSRQWLRDSQP